jgi:hypothetical protein
VAAQAQAFNPASKEYFDPMGQAQASGQIGLPPLDLESKNSQNSLKARADSAEKLKVFHGLNYDPPPFTLAEAEMLAGQIQASPREKQSELLGTLAKGLGPRHFAAALGQIAPKAPVFAQAGMMMAEGNARAANDQLLGAELRSNLAKGGEGLPRQYMPPKDDLMRSSLVKQLPHALLADLGPDVQASAQDAVMNAYAAKSYQLGKADQTVIDPALLASAVADVTGGLVKFNGRPVLAPVRGQDQDKFDAMIQSLGDNAFAGMFDAKGKPVSAAMVKRWGELGSLSRGRYLVRLEGMALLDGQGQPAVLDLNKGGR